MDILWPAMMHFARIYSPVTTPSGIRGYIHISTHCVGFADRMQEMTASEPLFVSSPTSIRAGSFARTCQAAHLLGRVIRHKNDQSLEPLFRLSEAAQLYRTIRALSLLLLAELNASRDVGTATALCYSSLMVLCKCYSCPETIRGQNPREEMEMQETALNGRKAAARDVVGFAQHLKLSMAFNIASASPLTSDCLYQAAANHAWPSRESGAAESAEATNEIRGALRMLDGRWRVAGK